MILKSFEISLFDGSCLQFEDCSLSMGISENSKDILVVSSVSKNDSFTVFHRTEILLHTIKSIFFLEDEKE